MRVKAYAKVNLTLEVLGRRADGYHLLRSIMHTVSLADTLHVEPHGDVLIVGDALPEDNTVKRALQAFLSETGLGGAVSVKKRIPSEAGLGGASADAAATLNALNSLYGFPVAHTRLMELGASIGADVPFCMEGGCRLAEGIGERLRKLPPLSLPLLIVQPDKGVSTALLFSRLAPPYPAVATDAALACVRSGNAPKLQNALQPTAEALVPEIAVLTRRLTDAGARAACMTGSGSAVFGIFASDEAAKKALPLFRDCAFAATARTLPSADRADLTALTRRY